MWLRRLGLYFRRAALIATTALLFGACGGGTSLRGPAVVTFPISALGAEGEILSRQLARFMAENPGIEVVKRITPDAADQKHQLYVQWLNAGASDPDIVQLDVIWTPEFAAAGWILPLNQFAPDTSAFFPSTIAANQWKDSLYALPWFIDVGMLYWRTDLMDEAPATYADLVRESSEPYERAVPGTVTSGRAPATRDWSPTSSSTSARMAARSWKVAGWS